MAFVQKAKSDIFTSYPIEIKDWVEKFQDDLKRQLVELLGPGKLDIYFAGVDWEWGSSDEMLKQAREAAILVATLVPGALSDDRSRFFELEWQAFAESASLFGSAETRFQLVLKLPVPSELLAKSFPLLPNQKAFPPINEFYDQEGNTLERRVAYKRKVGQVARRIKERLNDLNRNSVAQYADRVTGSATKGIGGMKAVLAKCDEGLREEWEQVRELLLNDGVEVFLVGDPPNDDTQWRKEVMREIERADLFLQLLDPVQEAIRQAKAATDPAAKPMKSRAQSIYECALVHLTATSRPFAIMQWRPTVDRRAFAYWPGELLDSKHVQVGSLQSFRQAVRSKLMDMSKLSGADETPSFVQTDRSALSPQELHEKLP
jgi:hypothetical protein